MMMMTIMTIMSLAISDILDLTNIYLFSKIQELWRNTPRNTCRDNGRRWDGHRVAGKASSVIFNK